MPPDTVTIEVNNYRQQEYSSPFRVDTRAIAVENGRQLWGKRDSGRPWEETLVKTLTLVLTLAMLSVLLLFAASSAAQTYTVTDLGVLPGDSGSLAYDLNASGELTGCSDTSTSLSALCGGGFPGDAYLWSSGKGMENLGALPGDNISVGYYVSNSDEVVGFSGDTTSGAAHAFLWTKKGGMIDLGTLPGGNGYSVADQIVSGVIVGQSVVKNGDVHLVLWTKSGASYTIQDEGYLPHAPYSYAYSMNDEFQVTGVGYFNEKGTKYHAFLWSAAAGWKDLGTLAGGKNSMGIWINDPGVIVGTSTSKEFPNGVAVFWDKNGGIHPIGTLAGGTSSFPGFIDDSGRVVGESTVSGGASHAFLWTSKTGLQDLNDMIPANSGWVLIHASAINRAGLISGYGTINGADHGFLLTP